MPAEGSRASIATLTSPNLRLVPLDLAHLALYRMLYTDPRVMAHIGSPLDDVAATAAFHRAVSAHQAPGLDHRTWAVTTGSAGREIGIAALWHRAADTDTEVGLMLLPVGWNGRYSHEVIDTVVAHAFDDLRLQRLTGICSVGPNERMSRRLLLPHGFVAATPDRAGTAQWVLDREAWTRPVGRAILDA